MTTVFEKNAHLDVHFIYLMDKSLEKTRRFLVKRVKNN